MSNLEIRTGKFKEIFPLFNPLTISHSNELTDDRFEESDEKKKEELRDTWFWTADYPQFDTDNKNKEPTLSLARGTNNLIFRHFPKSTDQILSGGNYTPNPEEARAVKKAKDTLVIPLRGLGLKEQNNAFSYFPFSTLNPRLTKDQRELLQRAYSKANFDRNMKMLFDAGITESRAWVLNPDYVTEKTKGGVYIARVARLYGFAFESRFLAVGRCLDDSDLSLRGGIRPVAEGDSKKSSAPGLDARLDLLDKAGVTDVDRLKKVLHIYQTITELKV